MTHPMNQKFDPTPAPLTEGQRAILDAIPMREPGPIKAPCLAQPVPARVAALNELTAEQERLGLYEQPFEQRAREALELIAAPMRGDGTWNRDREACRVLAAEALGRDEKTEPAAPAGEVVVTTRQDGTCVAVTRQDEDGRILSVIWQASDAAPSVAPEPDSFVPGVVLSCDGQPTLIVRGNEKDHVRHAGARLLYAHPPRAPLSDEQIETEAKWAGAIRRGSAWMFEPCELAKFASVICGIGRGQG